MLTRLVIVGGGPRAIGALERLAAHATLPEQARRLRTSPLSVDIIDPCMPGAGRIWQSEESPLLLMNSRATDVTIFTDDSVVAEGPSLAGPSLADWAQGIRDGIIAAPTAGTARLQEIHELRPESFASRRVQALYLEWFFGQVLAALPETIQVRIHRTTATAVRPAGSTADGAPSATTSDAAEGPGRVTGPPWTVDLEGRDPLEADLLLLAAGHTDSRPSAARHDLAAFARRHGGAYLPPSQASDAPIDQLPAGGDVIVRGMGLGFIDLMALLTEGRGGAFEPDPHPGAPGRLRYLASGEEPRLWIGSRRGVPYHSKVTGEGDPAGPTDLVHVTEAELSRLEDEHGSLDFRGHVLPLIAAEVARAVPDAPVAADGEDPLDWLDDPLSWIDGDADQKLVRDAVVRHIEHDLHSRAVGDTSSSRALFQVILRISGALVDLLPPGRLREDSHGDYPRWWHSLFSFVDSGPPPHRLHQLLALERAGVVTFLGPRTRVWADDETGLFHARGAGTEVRAHALVDAFLSEPTLRESTNPLLRSLVAGAGAGAVAGEGAEGAIGRESAAAPGKLDVDAEHRVIAPDGGVRDRLWAIGPWTSELPIGAFARPGTNAPCFRRNDALAARLLEAAAQVGGGRDADAQVEGRRSADARGMGGRAADAAPRTAPGRRPASAPRLGILGAGKIGTALARSASRAGLEVHVSGRADSPQVTARIPGAVRVPLEELGERSDIIVLAAPLHVALSLDPEALAGAVVIDATNPWGSADEEALRAARSGPGAPAESGTTSRGGAGPSTSELLAAHLSRSRVVKSLNHIGYHDVEDHGRPAGHPERRALAVAADDSRAADAVSALLGRLGFDAVRLGPLACGRHLEPGGGLFSGWSTSLELDRARGALQRVA